FAQERAVAQQFADRHRDARRRRQQMGVDRTGANGKLPSADEDHPESGLSEKDAEFHGFVTDSDGLGPPTSMVPGGRRLSRTRAAAAPFAGDYPRARRAANIPRIATRLRKVPR